jgi:hypothetical protein
MWIAKALNDWLKRLESVISDCVRIDVGEVGV